MTTDPTNATPDPFAGALSDEEWLRADARDRRRRGLREEADRLDRLADEIHGTRQKRRAA